MDSAPNKANQPSAAASQPTAGNTTPGTPPAGPEHRKASPPPKLHLPTRLSDQIEGLHEYAARQEARAATSTGGALRTTDRDKRETRKVHTILASVGFLFLVGVGAIILAGSHSQPTEIERLAWNQEEMQMIQRCLFRFTPQRLDAAAADPAAGGDRAKAAQSLLLEQLKAELARTDEQLETNVVQSDGDRWLHKKRDKYILERTLAWIDGYDRPFNIKVAGLRVTVSSFGANGHLDASTDLSHDDLFAAVRLPDGVVVEVKRWEELFSLPPTQDQVVLFDPSDANLERKIRSMDRDHLLPRERMAEARFEYLDLMDSGLQGTGLEELVEAFKAGKIERPSAKLPRRKEPTPTDLPPQAVPEAVPQAVPPAK